MTRRPHPLPAVLAAALLVAGCGGDDGEGAATTTTPTSTAPSTGQAASPDPAREEQAKAAVLQPGDFPPGWKEHHPEEGLNLEETWRDLTRCLGVEAGDTFALATSPTYLRGLATQARSTVEYMPEAAAERIAAALARPEFTRCATEAFTADARRSAPEGATPGEVQVRPLADFPQLGEVTSATRVNLAMNLGELQVPIFQDLIVVFDGESVSRLMFLNPGSEFPPELQRSLTQKVVDRA